jgi:hypothetical protein
MDRLVLFTKLLLDYCLSLITPEIISFFSKSFLVLTYRHELGMNYNFIRPDLIVGSCLQSPLDVDKLRDIGVKTVFCLQQDPDLEYPYY